MQFPSKFLYLSHDKRTNNEHQSVNSIDEQQIMHHHSTQTSQTQDDDHSSLANPSTATCSPPEHSLSLPRVRMTDAIPLRCHRSQRRALPELPLFQSQAEAGRGDEHKLHVMFLVDESGSMVSHSKAVVEAVNDFVAKQISLSAASIFSSSCASVSSVGSSSSDLFYLSVYKFSSGVSSLCESAPLNSTCQPPQFPPCCYLPHGGTALYDSVATLIQRFSSLTRVLFVIITDGLDNDSRSHSRFSVATLISQQRSRGWNFCYLSDASCPAVRVQGEQLGVSDEPDNGLNNVAAQFQQVEQLRAWSQSLSEATWLYRNNKQKKISLLKHSKHSNDERRKERRATVKYLKLNESIQK